MTFCVQGLAHFGLITDVFLSFFFSTSENNRSVVAERRSESGRRSLYHLSQVVTSETITFFFFRGVMRTHKSLIRSV